MPLLFTSQSHQQQQQQQPSTSTTATKYTINSNNLIPTKSSKLPGTMTTKNSSKSFKLKNGSETATTSSDYSPIIMKFNSTTTTTTTSQQNHHQQQNGHQNHLFRHMNNTNGNNTTSSTYRSLNLNVSHCSTADAQPQAQPRVTFVLPSNSSSNSNILSKSVNISTTSTTSQTTPYIKTKRSGSITTLLPLKETPPTMNRSSKDTNNSTTPNKPIISNRSNGSNLGGSSTNAAILKRRKSNSLSIIDYCNIINLNTNYQMLATFYDDTEESMARLSMRTNNHKDISKQASLSEQVAALFGSSMCTCYLCNLKSTAATTTTTTTTTTTASFSFPSSAASSIDSTVIGTTSTNGHSSSFSSTSNNASATTSTSTTNRKAQQHNFEIMPNKNNADFSVMKYTYSTPFSQLSTLKLFNLMNTDCSINFNVDSQFNNKNNDNSSSCPVLPNINNPSSNPTSTTNTSQSSSSTMPNIMPQINSNSPPIYDTRYLYLIDCRPNRKRFDKSRIHTAIHYTDLLTDSVYLSPPLDNYTLIVLYDDDGTFLTSSSSSSSQQHDSSSPANSSSSSRLELLSSDEIISRLKAKINCSSSKTIYILSGGFEQFYAKFPFMCSSLEIRSLTDRQKYLTIYPNCVIENQFYIGSGIQAKNWKIIRDLQITHIINSSIEHECVFLDEIKYLHVKIEDSYQENIYRVIDKALKFIDDAFNKYYADLAAYNDEKAAAAAFEQQQQQQQQQNKTSNNNLLSTSSRQSSANTITTTSSSTPTLFYLGNSKNSSSNLDMAAASTKTNRSASIKSITRPKRPVFLIHCNLGISRSSSILIAYMINKYKLCLYAAFNYVKDKRLQIAPNYSFLRQLKQFEEEFY